MTRTRQTFGPGALTVEPRLAPHVAKLVANPRAGCGFRIRHAPTHDDQRVTTTVTFLDHYAPDDAYRVSVRSEVVGPGDNRSDVTTRHTSRGKDVFRRDMEFRAYMPVNVEAVDLIEG